MPSKTMPQGLWLTLWLCTWIIAASTQTGANVANVAEVSPQHQSRIRELDTFNYRRLLSGAMSPAGIGSLHDLIYGNQTETRPEAVVCVQLDATVGFIPDETWQNTLGYDITFDAFPLSNQNYVKATNGLAALFAPYPVSVGRPCQTNTSRNRTLIEVCILKTRSQGPASRYIDDNPNILGLAIIDAATGPAPLRASPVLIFMHDMVRGDPEMLARIAAHEVGHTLGLRHDTRSGHATGYYRGTVPDLAGPIMGSPYHAATVHWSRSLYQPGVNQTHQDDPQVLYDLPATAKTRRASIGQDRCLALGCGHQNVAIPCHLDVMVYNGWVKRHRRKDNTCDYSLVDRPDMDLFPSEAAALLCLRSSTSTATFPETVLSRLVGPPTPRDQIRRWCPVHIPTGQPVYFRIAVICLVAMGLMAAAFEVTKVYNS